MFLDHLCAILLRVIKKIFSDSKIFNKIGIGILLGFALFLFIPHSQKSSEVKGKYAELVKDGVLYHVDHALDGDTFVANISGHDVTVRLIGMDTPEVVDPRKPVQCFGPEASAKGKELLNGKEVYIEKEKAKGDYDIYGRVLAYARFSDGILYNQFMIEEGFAKEYTFNKEKYKYQEEFKEAQKKAQKEKKGLWGGCPKK